MKKRIAAVPNPIRRIGSLKIGISRKLCAVDSGEYLFSMGTGLVLRRERFERPRVRACSIAGVMA